MKYIDWLIQWLENYIRPSVKVRTYERYRLIIEQHIKDKIGSMELDDLSPLVLFKTSTRLVVTFFLTDSFLYAVNVFKDKYMPIYFVFKPFFIKNFIFSLISKRLFLCHSAERGYSVYPQTSRFSKFFAPLFPINFSKSKSAR